MNQKQFLAITAAFAAGMAVGANWPTIKEKLGPWLDDTGDKVGDFYSALARMMSECKEGFEDKMAEQKSNSRSSAKTTAADDFLSSLSAVVDGSVVVEGQQNGSEG